jgi:hypothetical protein
LSVYGDVNNYIPLDSSISFSVIISGISAVSKTEVKTNSNVALQGQTITFSASTLSIAKNGSSSSAKVVTVNQKVSAGSFDFKAQNDSYNIFELKFVIPNYAQAKIISSAVLVDAVSKKVLTTNPAMVTNDGLNYFLNFTDNILVDLNSTKTIEINYDLGKNFDSSNANIDISPALVFVKATNKNGKIFDGFVSKYINTGYSYGGITLPDTGVLANKLYVFKSMPFFEASGTLALSDSTAELYKFSITADKNSEVAVKQLKFVVSFNDPNFTNPRLNDFKLYKGEQDYTNSVAIVNVINKNYIGLQGENAIGVGIDNVVVVSFYNEEVIPAGQKQAYTLKANVKALTKSTKYGADSISTYMSGDAEFLSGASWIRPIAKEIYFGLAKSPAEEFNISEYSILWSDRSSPYPNTHNNFNSLYTQDWYNGYNSSLGTQTITAK